MPQDMAVGFCLLSAQLEIAQGRLCSFSARFKVHLKQPSQRKAFYLRGREGPQLCWATLCSVCFQVAMQLLRWQTAHVSDHQQTTLQRPNGSALQLFAGCKFLWFLLTCMIMIYNQKGSQWETPNKTFDPKDSLDTSISGTWNTSNTCRSFSTVPSLHKQQQPNIQPTSD